MRGRKELVEEGPDKQIRKALALDQPTLLFETCAYYDENKLFKLDIVDFVKYLLKQLLNCPNFLGVLRPQPLLYIIKV